MDTNKKGNEMKTKFDKKFRDSIHSHTNSSRTLCMDKGLLINGSTYRAALLPRWTKTTTVKDNVTCEECRTRFDV